MTDLILHHFAASPFSEKLRLVLGYKALAAKSVLVPFMMPKPDVLALTGGYRRTPFLQIGADVYCDSALVCEVLEALLPTPPLYPQPTAALARMLGQWADSTLFWAAIRHNRGPKGAGVALSGASAAQVKSVLEDRKAMGFDLEWQQPVDATAPYQTYLQRLAEQLGAQPYLLGAQPCIADFCVYHPLWYAHLRSAPAVDLLAPWPALRAWLARMSAIGHGELQEIGSDQAIATAAQSEPKPPGQNLLPDGPFHDEHGIALGSSVGIAAESFGPEMTHGVLVAATRTHYSLHREDARAGLVHVHFPRIGYVLKPT